MGLYEWVGNEEARHSPAAVCARPVHASADSGACPHVAHRSLANPAARGVRKLPRAELQRIEALSPHFARLVEAIAVDTDWLRATLASFVHACSESISPALTAAPVDHRAAEADEFTRALLDLQSKVAEEGIVQPARLAIMRALPCARPTATPPLTPPPAPRVRLHAR